MLRLNLLLFLILLGCAISVVTARHEARDLFVKIQKAEARGRALDIEWGRLLLEQSTWAMHTRVEVVARNQLHMSVPDPSRVFLLRLPEEPHP
jgi:cell division protein FtsL